MHNDMLSMIESIDEYKRRPVTTAGCSQIDIFVLSFIYGCIRL